MRETAPGAVIRRWREERGWTLVEAGQRCGYSAASMSRLERGKQPLTDLRVLHGIARGLEIPLARLAPDITAPAAAGHEYPGTRAALTSPHARQLSSTTDGPTPTEEDDTDRRDTLKAVVNAGLVVAGLPLVNGAADAIRRPTPDHVAELTRAAQLYRSSLYHHGATTELQHGLTSLLDHASALATQAGGALRSQFLAVMGDVAGVAAYASRDRNQTDHAQTHYLLGIQAAHAADDPRLTSYLLVRLAGLHLELHQPRQVHHYLDGADQIDQDICTSAERANRYMLRAWANAQAQQAQDVHTAVGHAEEQLAHSGGEATNWNLRHSSPAELYSLTGASYVDLARHHPSYAPEAIHRLEQAVHLRGPGFARNALLDTISLGEAHVLGGDLEAASHYATQTALAARASASRRVRQRLATLTRELYNRGITPRTG